MLPGSSACCSNGGRTESGVTLPDTAVSLLQVDLDLIERLLQAICCEGPFATLPAGSKGTSSDVAGAILVFLPGWDEIMRLKDRLETSLSSSRWDLP